MKSLSRIATIVTLVCAPMLCVSTPIASAATGTPDDELTIDCIEDSGKYFYLWNYAETPITVNFTNCDYHEHRNADDEVITADVPMSPINMIPNDYLFIWNTSITDGVFVRTGQLVQARTPSGELQYRQEVTITDQKTFDAGVANHDDDEHWLGGKKLCELDVEDGGRHVYSTIDITIVKEGRYTFRSIATDPLSEYLGGEPNPASDSFLALYSSFDPANPDDGVIGCNDDLNNMFGYANNDVVEVLPDGTWMEGHQPYFSAELEPGDYTLLVTTWRAINRTEFNGGEAAGDVWTPGPFDLTFELWGPVASLCIGQDGECDPVDPTESTLPPTGTNSGPVAPLALVSLMVGLVGVLVVKRRLTT